MSKVLILQGHPDKNSYVSALADAYHKGVIASQRGVQRIDLVDLQFDPILRSGYGLEQGLEPDLVRAREAIEQAEHVAFFFPTWWGSMPALVKGFVDRLFLPGIAFQYEEGRAMPKQLWKGRSARFVTTMDSPAFWYLFKHGRSHHGSFVSATLDLVGFSPVRTTTLYNVRKSTPESREQSLKKLRGLGLEDGKRLQLSHSRELPPAVPTRS